MDKNLDILVEEPTILSFAAYRRPEPPDDHNDSRPQRHGSDNEGRGDEIFWAGRNHAMRRSARWAA